MTDLTDSMFHGGHRELQDRFDGRRMADALEKHRRLSQFRDEDIEFIEGSEFFFLATAHENDVDCSFRGGAPGFVRVTGPTSLEWPDFDGNSMYRSLGNALRSPRVGLLFIRFGAQPRRLRVNGACRLLDGRIDKGHKMIVQVDADQIFPNCPRYIPDLSANEPSEYLPKAGEPVPKPVWKDRDYIKPLLAETDPHKDQT